MKQWIGGIVLALVVSAVVYFVVQQKQVEENVSLVGEGRITVVATLFPLYDFAKEIGGDRVDVTLLLPPGVEPHSFEPKPSDILTIHTADIFVYAGKFMEPWASDIIRGASSKGSEIVDSSVGVTMMSDILQHHEHDGHDHDSEELTELMDPHIWLDFDNDKKIVENLTLALIRKDPLHKEEYQRNSERYLQKLQSLDDRYQEGLSECRSREILYGGHYAFGYLANRYNLTYVAAQGMSHDSEPSAKDLAQLVDQIRMNQVQTVFYEELASPKIAETLAQETQAQLLLLSTASNVTKEDFTKGVSFISIMEENLKNLQEGLGCSS